MEQAKNKRRRRGVELSVAAQRRKQIIDAARACIAEEGVEKLTLRGVAQRAQIGHATIAYYFQSRREVVDAALMEMSTEFLLGLQRRRRVNGTRRLEQLLHDFLDPENPTARFVIQMIDSGLHDVELRRSHDDFVKYGRDSIRQSIQTGIEKGELQPDLDAHTAAALFHSVLVWWEAEIIAGAESSEKAREVALLLLSLFHRNDRSDLGATADIKAHDRPTDSTLEVIDDALANDTRLSSKASNALAAAIRSLYAFAIEAPYDDEELTDPVLLDAGKVARDL